MNRSVLSIGVGVALGLAAAMPAFAGEVPPEQVAVLEEVNAASLEATENAALAAYKANINPLASMLQHVGPYDLSDAFTGPNGYALPGWGSIANPASGSGGDAAGG